MGRVRPYGSGFKVAGCRAGEAFSVQWFWVLRRFRLNQGPAVAVAEVDLTQRFVHDYIGDWKDTYQRQQRPSAYGRRER